MMKEIDQKWAACIVYYQDQDSLNNLLNCLESQTLKPTNVFIADNDSREEIKINSLSFPVKVIRLNENRGFAGGANVALTEAINNDFSNLMLLSQDVLLENDSAQKLIAELNNSRGIVFPTMINRKTNTVFSKGGKISKFWGSIKLANQDVPKDVDWADGSCLAFTSDLFKSVNGLNEKFFMYFEDVDFCLKAKSKGFNLTHVSTIASQTPNGPSPLMRSKNSVLLARRTGSALFMSSVTKRNFLGAILLLARFRFNDSAKRLRGIFQGWKMKID
jgi:N-acetylglucosaminyl-diphospho-decaprenol L-rhamnosyltransferase